MTEPVVEVVRSHRRKRTVSGRIAEGRFEVRVPAGLNDSEEARLVADMTARLKRRVVSDDIDLGRRASELADRYGLRRPARVEWSGRQMQRWGSCTPSAGHIRISDRLASMPVWVLDSVLVHELAHLEEANHGQRFQTLVERYPLTERARGYLMAVDDRIPA
jgi:predicted metal-dependent hydrolase